MPENSSNKGIPKFISIHGAKMHNLKNVSLDIPRNKMTVITGLSGSGKSSLAFDTLFAEGQRRYVESLSAYARQFLGKFEKPNVDKIEGLSPAIAIEQKVMSRNPRSTVGTSTEIYDYLKLLFTRIGRTYSPISGEEVKKHNTQDVLAYLKQFELGTKGFLTAPILFPEDRTIEDHLVILQKQGFSRLFFQNEIISIDDFIKEHAAKANPESIQLLVSRFKYDDTDTLENEFLDAVQTAFYEGNGACNLCIYPDFEPVSFNNRFELDGVAFTEPSLNFFTFNSPLGACPKCEGFGQIIGIDENLVIPDQSLSIYQGAVICWNGEKLSKWRKNICLKADEVGLSIHKPYHQLSTEEKDLLWNGCKAFKGIHQFFEALEAKMYKVQNRVMLARYRGKTTCHTCKGKRLRPETYYVKINGKSINDLVDIPIDQLKIFFDNLELNEYDQSVVKRILLEINNRISYLIDVGLPYLTLNRLSSSLSGGESQRINLSTSLGSSLVGSMYILDEPSIGLHPRDTQNLIRVLNNLKDLGNTVIIVEHEDEVIKAADHIVDIGPQAGYLGGELVFEGDLKALKACKNSLTADYMFDKKKITRDFQPKKHKHFIKINKAAANNLKNIDVEIPLNAFTVVTGVSGSGKSTLIGDILYPAIKRQMGIFTDIPGTHESVECDLKKVQAVSFIDQNPIGKSSRSNPVSYIKAYDDIRTLFSQQKLAKIYGYKPSHFSFNVQGGRCDNCEGEGVIHIEMQFMSDIHVTCEECNGQRFKEEVLEVEYNGVNIAQLLDMTIDEAYQFFQKAIEEDPKNSRYEKKINDKLQCLVDVGMGYVKMGQSSSTLSGGEAQRVKLASFLIKGDKAEPTLFIFDEPTTGLHFHDINKLLNAFNALLKNGHHLIVIEHNTDVIKNADWIVDIGPEGGEKGGELMYQGPVSEIGKVKKGYTYQYLE